MTKSVWINGGLVRHRMHAQSMSDRDLAALAGTATTAIRSIIVDDALSTSITIAQFRRLATAIGVTAGELLDEPSPDGTSTSTDDAKILTQVLCQQSRGQQPERIARALGWDLERVDAAIEYAQTPLHILGLAIHHASSGLILRPRDDLRDVQRSHDRLQDAVEGLSNATERVLYIAYEGTLPKNDRRDHMPHLGRLHNLGVLEDQRGVGGMRHEPSESLKHALNF